MVMSSMQLHPLFALAGITTSASSSASTSSSLSSGNNSGPVNVASMIAMPNGSVLPSGLSISITPASNPPPNLSTSIKMDIDPPSSPMSTSSNNLPSPSPSNSSTTANAQQQQALRALANGLTASLQSVTSNMSNSSATANSLNQASLLAAASKLMELNANPVDDIVMQEITQRLVKMNQELWQQASVSATASATATTTTSSGSGHGSSSSATATSSGGHGNHSSGHGHGHGGSLQQQQQANELKLAEKLVNELAVQQSTRNAFHLNERTLQECWSTLQRVSCMIFMHKSAMQLQQQQQQQQQQHAVVAQQQGQSHHGLNGPGPHGHHHRPGSVSSVGSESGVSKPHQCQQCLKAFSSNHQLVQHIRVHTGEKPYKCSYCDRRFKQLSHVQQHTRLHTGERPYKCHVHDCGRAFIQLSNLQQHLRNHDAQLERSKNRPFHCNICGKGFATESSLRTHTSKQHAALIGGPNAVTCPICHKLFLGGEALMEHMKHTHKDPNASGVATKRRTANHPCPICGKHYVNEGSLRKHLTCHPETAQLTTSLRMWPCSVCQAVFTHESGLLTHMEQMRMDPKHQFAAQYVLSRAAAERRERENVLTAAAISAMAQAGGHPFGNLSQGQSLGSLLPIMPPSPSGSESSGRLSSPLDTNNSGLSHSANLQHSRMSLSSPVNGPLDARITNNNTSSSNNNSTPPTNNPSNTANNNNNNSSVDSGSSQVLGRKDYANAMDKYEPYEKMSHHHGENNNISSLLSGMRGDPHLHHAQHSGGLPLNATENGPSGKYQAAEQAAMKMAAMLGQGHGGGHGHGHSQNDLRNLIHHHSQNSSGQMHSQEMMSTGDLAQRIQAEALIRSQAAEALRLAVVGNMDRSSMNGAGINNGINPNGTNGNMNSLVESLGNHLSLSLAQQQQQQQAQQHQQQQIQQHNELHRGNAMSNGHNGSNHHPMHHHASSLNQHQLNSLLSQQTDLSEALLRLDPRSLGFQIPAHNS